MTSVPGSDGTAGSRPFVTVTAVAGATTTITLSSPQNRNALSTPLLAELAQALRAANDDPAVRAIVLTGEGSTFCSGADLAERRAGADAPVPAPGEDMASVLGLIAASPKPVVGRVNGHVRAGGMGLVAACDVAVAVHTATFGFTEVRVGVAPALIAVPATSVMEPRAFRRYALTGEIFDAPTAVAVGLVDEAVVAADLDGAVGHLVDQFRQASPAALAATKQLLGRLHAMAWDEAMAEAGAVSSRLFASADAAEGMQAFLEKRSPSWTAEPE
jgi:methylglutaconyl-CoA hydratase